jgi:hypothetical protein
MVGDHLHGTPFGYSPFTDLLSLQQAINNLASILLSNNLTFGSQYIHTSDGELDVKKLDGGLRLLTSAEPPTPLQLTRSAPESFNFLNSLMGYQDTLSGINSTVKGNPPAQATSGAAMALLVSQALQYNSGLQESHNKTVESVGTKIVSHLQTFAKTPRLALIVGEANRPFLKQYSGLDIQGIKRVTVEESNPMSQTISGRLQIADSLMEKGLIKNANQYISILNGGTLDNATFSVQAAEINIKAENEALLDGEPVQALIIDDPIAHILSHRDVISSPEARRDPQVIANVLDHIHQHISLWRSADPALLQLLGFQPPPAPPAPAPQMQTPTAAGMPEDQPSGPNLPDLPDEAPENNQAMYQNQIKGE